MSDFSIKFSICLNGTHFDIHTILCSSASITLFLSCASLMHIVAPSNIQPSTSFLTAHWPSPGSNFLLDIISWPLFPDTCGGVNTLLIPCRNYPDKWSNCSGSLVFAMCIKLSKNTSSMVQNGFSSNRGKNLLHSFFLHILAFSRPSSSDIWMLRQCPNTFVSMWLWYITCCFWRHMEEARRQCPSHCRADGINNSVGESGWFGRT